MDTAVKVSMAAQRLVDVAKTLVGQKMDSARFLFRVFTEAQVGFSQLQIVEQDARGRRASEPGDVVQILEKDNNTYNPVISIGNSCFIFANPATGKVEKDSFINLAIAKTEIAKIMRVV